MPSKYLLLLDPCRRTRKLYDPNIQPGPENSIGQIIFFRFHNIVSDKLDIKYEYGAVMSGIGSPTDILITEPLVVYMVLPITTKFLAPCVLRILSKSPAEVIIAFKCNMRNTAMRNTSMRSLFIL